MNKIDDFFNKRLDTEASSNEGWNMPSDDLWNAAKPHFPKEQKRKSFLWFWLSLGILVISGVAVLHYSEAGDDSIYSEGLNDSNINKEITNDFLVFKEIEEIKEGSINEGDIIELNTIDVNENQYSNEVEQATEANERKFKSNKADKHKNETSNRSIAISVTEEVVRNDKIKSQGIDTQSIDINRGKKISLIAVLKEKIDVNASNDIVVSSKSENKLIDQVNTEVSDSASRTTENRIVVDEVRLLEKRNNSSVVANGSQPLPNKTYPFMDPKVIVWPRKEVGISSQLFFMNLLNGVDLDDTSDGRVVFNGKYRNLNFKYSKWIGRKWSLTTGLHLSSLSVNLDIDTNIEYDEDEFEEIIETQYGEAINENYTAGSENNFILKSGVELVNGDVLRFDGNVNLGLKVIQIPILLNYHWYNRKFEFYTGIGFTFEALWASEEDVEFELFDDGVLISEPVVQSSGVENYLDYSIYTKLGTKYNINRNLNLDVALSIPVTQIIFSGVEVGLHYRWHQ